MGSTKAARRAGRNAASLWQAAVELARQHGIYAVAHPLRLDYTRLKQRLGGMPSQPRKQNKPAFVELIGDGAAALPECVIVFESPGGGKMRIQWKRAVPPTHPESGTEKGAAALQTLSLAKSV